MLQDVNSEVRKNMFFSIFIFYFCNVFTSKNNKKDNFKLPSCVLWDKCAVIEYLGRFDLHLTVFTALFFFSSL